MTKKTRAKARRALLTLSLVLVMMVAAVGGTIAWLTDSTGDLLNTFTIGDNITISLDEGEVYEEDEEGTTVTNLGKHIDKENNRTEEGNTYELVPGYTYDKDPIVRVGANSGDCYVFVKVTNPFTDIEVQGDEEKPTIAEQMAENGWIQLEVEGVQDVFYYQNVVKTATTETPLPVFENLHTKSDLEYDDLLAHAGDTITVDAYAIQAEGFANAAAAWGANSVTWEE